MMSTVPKIRFKRDDGSDYPEWVEKQLGEIVIENLDPVPTPKGGYRRVGVYCHAKGTFQEDVPEDKILDVDKMFRLHKDNLIVNITFAWEHAIAIVKEEDDGLLVSHRFPEYKFVEGQIPGFYKYLILRPYIRQRLYLASPGGAGRNRVLKRSEFLEIPIAAPAHPEEQTKIATFLSQVDEVIRASEEEVATLQQLKKGMMQKIFSQEVRFKREDGSDYPEWKEKSLREVGRLLSGGTPSTDHLEYWNGNIQWFTPSEIGKTKYVTNSNRTISDLGLKKSSAKILPKGTLLITTRATLGEISIACNDCTTNQGFHPLIVNDDVHNEFVYYHQPFIKKYCEKYACGSTFNEISASKLGEMPIRIPHLEEQTKIVAFFTSMDNAITAAQEELEKYKELKKGLLQQMFV
jgi:type I restriction enzyme S subunit